MLTSLDVVCRWEKEGQQYLPRWMCSCSGGPCVEVDVMVARLFSGTACGSDLSAHARQEERRVVREVRRNGWKKTLSCSICKQEGGVVAQGRRLRVHSMLLCSWERIVSARGEKQVRAGGGNLFGVFEP